MGIIEKMRLDGKAIYVTGAASGIGKCAAMAFAEAGADVAIVDINLEGAQKVAEEIKEATGSNTIAIQCDVTNQEQVEAMVAKVVETYGKLDACYNNAGICINEDAEKMTYEQWLKVININLNVVFLCATAGSRTRDAQTGLWFHYQHRFHVRTHCKCSAAAVCIQCIQGRRDHADQIPGSRVGKEKCTCKLHQPRIYRN